MCIYNEKKHPQCVPSVPDIRSVCLHAGQCDGSVRHGPPLTSAAAAARVADPGSQAGMGPPCSPPGILGSLLHGSCFQPRTAIADGEGEPSAAAQSPPAPDPPPQWRAMPTPKRGRRQEQQQPSSLGTRGSGSGVAPHPPPRLPGTTNVANVKNLSAFVSCAGHGSSPPPGPSHALQPSQRRPRWAPGLGTARHMLRNRNKFWPFHPDPKTLKQLSV